MKCKFCGCTDDLPCAIPVDVDGAIAFSRVPDLFPSLGPALFDVVPCAWLIPEVCTAPACVEKAYLALRIVDGVGLELTT